MIHGAKASPAEMNAPTTPAAAPEMTIKPPIMYNARRTSSLRWFKAIFPAAMNNPTTANAIVQ